MRLIVVLAATCGVVVGVLVAPRLIEVSPWFAVLVVLVVLMVSTYYEVQRRERKLDREVRGRFPPGHPRSKDDS